MGIARRRKLYEELEQLRGRPLIVYVTSSRPHATGMMAGDAIPEILDQLNAAPANPAALDILVVSQGGDAAVAWQTMSLLRERCGQVAVLVPQAAFSAATLLALGANEIVMHPNGNLGPVDPQISAKRKVPGVDKPIDVQFGYEDLIGFLEFVREEARVTDQAHVKSLFEQFCSEVGPVPVGIAARGSQLSISMGEKLLRMHMKEESDVQKARGIAETLNKKFFHHGYPVSRTEAIEIGLKVADRNPPVEQKMWEIWLDVEDELKIRKPFDPTVEILSSPGAGPLLQAVPQVNLPPSLPPPILQAVVQQVMNQLMGQPGGNLVDYVPATDFEVVSALSESSRLASRFVTKGKILAARMPDLELRVSVMPMETGWRRIDLPADNS
jgi:hypothetical protein